MNKKWWKAAGVRAIKTIAQTKATKQVVKFIRKWCPNAKTIIRHWDVNGKSCPALMIDTNNKKRMAFKKAISQ